LIRISLFLSLCLQLAVLLICCISFSRAEELEAKPTDDKAEPVATTKLTPSVEEPKSKTEKRDSSDQTGTVFIGSPSKETSFRPVYPAASYYETPAESDSIFEPTTVRYTAADAAPQHQHQPQQQQQQHVAPPHRFSYAASPQVELYQRAIGKAPSAMSGPIYNYVEAEPSMYERFVPQQYQLGATAAAPHQLSLSPGHRVQYIIAIPLSYMRQLQQQLSGNLLHASPTPSSSSSSSSTTTSSSTTSTTSTAAPPSTPEAALAAGSHPILQLLGPLARDHQGLYRPYYQSDVASAPAVAGPTPASPYAQQYLQIPASVLLAATQQLQQHHQQHQQQLQLQQQQQSPSPSPSQSPSQSQVQTQYLKAAPTTAASTLYQPFVYQPQLQLPRLYPAASMIYAEQPLAQHSTLYGESTYPLAQQQHQHQHQPQQHHHQSHHQPLQQQQQQQHHHHQHHQQQQQQQQGRLVRLGPKHGQHKYAAVPLAATAAAVPAATATTTTTTTAATLVLPTAATATHEAVQQQQQQPIVHYNPIYVQAPSEQQPQQQHQFAILPRFSNNNPKASYNLGHESAPPIHVVRLSAASQPLQSQSPPQLQPQPIHHYHHYQPLMAAPQPHQALYQPHALPLANYIEEQPQQQQQQGGGQVSPALIPYFSHPGAVHYGTHLYHPASVAAAAAATGAKQQQMQQQQQQQQQRQAAEASATSGRLAADSGAKQPTAATNIVKYP
ncbi:hypothetical protein KR093_006192, partial [Drosophila rubida]